MRFIVRTVAQIRASDLELFIREDFEPMRSTFAPKKISQLLLGTELGRIMYPLPSTTETKVIHIHKIKSPNNLEILSALYSVNTTNYVSALGT